MKNTLLILIFFYCLGCGDKSAQTKLSGNVNEDALAKYLQERFQEGAVPSMNQILGEWAECQIYSTVTSMYTSIRVQSRYSFVQDGHLINNTAATTDRIWRLDETFHNDAIEAIPLPEAPIDPAVTRYGRLSQGKLIIEATTSDSRVMQFTLPSISDASLHVHAYEICEK